MRETGQLGKAIAATKRKLLRRGKSKKRLGGRHPRVYITVSGGVASVVRKDYGVELVLQDQDNEPVTTETWTPNMEVKANG
jgi:hypothetical protein